MANYALTINSRFRPFSYSELVQPLLQATQEQNALEEAYDELSQKASVWEGMANEQSDPRAYKLYKSYADDLKMQAGKLASSGLNTTSRRDLSRMKTRYMKDIHPIEIAYNKREKLAEEQRKLMQQDPDRFFERYASKMSLDDFLKNPTIDYGRSYSGAQLEQDVSKIASNLKTALLSGNVGKLKKLGLPFQYEQLVQYGYTPQQIEQAILNPQDGDPILTSIVDQAINASGIKDWMSNEEINKRVRPYANKGLYSAIGKTESKHYTDNFSMQDTLSRRAEARAEARRRQQEAANKPVQTVNLIGNPYDLASIHDVNKSQEKHNKYAKYFDPTTGNLTKEGWNEYNKIIKKAKPGYYGTGIYHEDAHSDFYNFMNSLNGGRVVTSQKGLGPWARKRFGDLYRANQERLNNSGSINADVLLNRAFDVQFSNPGDAEQILKSSSAFDATKAPTYVYTRDGYKEKGEINLHSDKFKEAKYSGEYGLRGNFIVITTKDGKKYRVALKDVNKSADQAINNALQAAKDGYYGRDASGNRVKLSDAELNAYVDYGSYITRRQDMINAQFNAAYDNFQAAMMQGGVKPRETEGGVH